MQEKNCVRSIEEKNIKTNTPPRHAQTLIRPRVVPDPPLSEQLPNASNYHVSCLFIQKWAPPCTRARVLGNEAQSTCVRACNFSLRARTPFLWVIRARTRPTLVTVGESHLSLHLNMYIYIRFYVYTTSTSTYTSTIVQQVLNMIPTIFLHDTTSPYRFLLLVSLKVRPAGDFAVDWGRFAHTRSHML